MSDLPKRLRIKASMIALGERIAWGSDTAIMEEAADMIESLSAERDALRAEAEALRVALLGIASVNPTERGIEWAKAYASDGLKGAGSELYARWLDTFKEAEALRAENARLRQQLADVFEGNTKLHVLWTEAVRQRDKLAQVLGNVEREHELFRRMKNCEIQRGRGSFGIAVMSDPPALEWQALDKELQLLIDDRRAALAAELAAIKGQEVAAYQWLDTGHFRKKIPAASNKVEWRPLYAMPAASHDQEGT